MFSTEIVYVHRRHDAHTLCINKFKGTYTHTYLCTVRATLLTAAIIFSAHFIYMGTIVERLLIEGGY